jgi:4-methoxybenzoate monooxygenase (O-demethylating)
MAETAIGTPATLPPLTSSAPPADGLGLPRFDTDPYADNFLLDPYPDYEAFREAGPVFWLNRYGVHAVARHQEVQVVLTRPDAFCSAAGVGLTNFKREESWRKPSIILEADPPEHGEKRRVLTRILSLSALRKLRPEFERQAAILVERMLEKGSCDGITDLAEAYPLKVFGDAVGLPAEGREHLLPYGDLVFNAFGPINDRFEKRMAASSETVAWIDAVCRREALHPNGFGAQLYAAADAGELTHDEAALLVRTLLSAGLDTTVFTLANAIVTLARHPDQWALLQQNPALARNALEEVMRFESTFQSFYRTTTQSVELGGVQIPPDRKIWVGIASANRDPRRWPDPEKFDVKRRASGHLAFGTGIHGCVGQMIARMEGEIVLQALANRVQSITPSAQPVVHLNNTVRGFSSMPICVTAKPR